MNLPRRLRDPLPWLGALSLALLATLILRDPLAAMLTALVLLATAVWWPIVRDQRPNPAAFDAIALRGGLSVAAILGSGFVATMATGTDEARRDAIVWASIAGAAAVFAMTSWIAVQVSGVGTGLLASLVAAAYAALALVALEIVVQSTAPSLFGSSIAAQWPPASIIGDSGIALRATIDRLLAQLLALPRRSDASAHRGRGVAVAAGGEVDLTAHVDFEALAVGAVACLAARVGGLAPRLTAPGEPSTS